MTTATTHRGTTNANDRGNSKDRRARRSWLMEAFRSDVDLAPGTSPETGAFLEPGHGIPTVRCYRCGDLLREEDITIDRVTPARRGGRYTRDNIRPACGPCNFGSTRHIGPWRDER